MVRRALLTLALAVLATALPARAEACTCVGPNPPCQAVWQATDVFVGHVVAIDASPADKLPFLSKLVRVRATEVFRGGATGEIEIWTGQGGGDCGYDFRTGETYLVYAYRNTENNRLTTGICSRTQRLNTAAEDLIYLRSLAKSTAKLGQIIGSAIRIDLPPAGETEGQRRTPFAGARVIAEGGGRTYEARTTADGSYEISVPPGTYAVRIVVPDGLYAYSDDRVTVPDARGCGSSVIAVHVDSRVAGRLVGADREPIPDFGLELMPVASASSRFFFPDESERVRTDARGLFEFQHLRTGTYYIGYDLRRTSGSDVVGPRVLLAGSDGQPRVLQVTAGARVNVEDLVMPPAKLVRVSGVVLEPDGGPAAAARVYVYAGTPENATTTGPAVVTERDGRFTMMVIADRSYKLVVNGYDATGRFVSVAESSPFTAAADHAGITLTLRPNR